MLSQTINLYGESIWEYNKIFQARKNSQKSTFYECFLRGCVALRLHRNKGVNQEKDMGSKSQQSRSSQLIQVRAVVAEVDGRKTDVSKEKGRVCACENQKKPGGFYKSVKEFEEWVHNNQTNESN